MIVLGDLVTVHMLQENQWTKTYTGTVEESRDIGISLVEVGTGDSLVIPWTSIELIRKCECGTEDS